MKLLLRLSLLTAALWGVGRFCIRATDKFTIEAIRSNRPYDATWETRPLSAGEREELERALDQPYTYFGRGGQSFVFFSADGQYALKFFRQEVFTPPVWLNTLPLPFFLDRYKEKKNWKRRDKLERDFGSYKIAFEELPEETGIVYVHLNKTHVWNKPLQIIDRLGIAHALDPNAFEFVIQRRAELIYPTITRLVRSGDLPQARALISQSLQFIVDRAKKGYHDRDPNIRTNCGLLDGRVIKIDVGRFVKMEAMRTPEIYKAEVKRIGAPLRAWLAEAHPELTSAYDEALFAIVSAP
jgi:hypothetical protein